MVGNIVRDFLCAQACGDVCVVGEVHFLAADSIESLLKPLSVVIVVLHGSVEALVPFFSVVGAVADFVPQTCLRQVSAGLFNGLLR